jgi:hypothetical protein
MSSLTVLKENPKAFVYQSSDLLDTYSVNYGMDRIVFIKIGEIYNREIEGELIIELFLDWHLIFDKWELTWRFHCPLPDIDENPYTFHVKPRKHRIGETISVIESNEAYDYLKNSFCSDMLFKQAVLNIMRI